VRITSRVPPSRRSSRRTYSSRSNVVTRADPSSTAACATAGATQSSTRGSNGFGMRYCGPNASRTPPYASDTPSGTSSRASAASARAAATFIPELIRRARTSSAPRNMNGKHSALLTWFGKSLRPVAMTTSSRAATASGYGISGSGLASAKTIGRRAIDRTMSGVTRFGPETPRKTSASRIASASVRQAVSAATRCFSAFIPSLRPFHTTPLLSTKRNFARSAPSVSNICAHEMPAAPAPRMTMRQSARRLPTTSQAFSSAAPPMIAVPCWSSWKTGMSSASTSRASTSKHSGAFTSSRLIPPNVGAMRRTVSTSASTVGASTSMSKTSMPANFLKRTAFPSITGLPASAPMLPSPRTAVPFVTTATRLPLFV
jgi:hypothetical protein